MSEVGGSWPGWADSAGPCASAPLRPRRGLLIKESTWICRPAVTDTGLWQALTPISHPPGPWHCSPSLPSIGALGRDGDVSLGWTMTAVYVNGGGLVTPHYARWERRDSVESGCQTECSKEDEEGQPRQLTPFEKLTQDMSQDEKVVREITLGKRIGFYRIRGEIGSGNFSQVKLGIHSLTKGRI